MSEAITLNAELRQSRGKGASRRLRREENKVPAIVYGGEKQPAQITMAHNKLIKAMENEAFYSSILTVDIEGTTERVIVKDIQRHPYRAEVLHMDLQRVNRKDVITKTVPLHYINEDICEGVKLGGVVSHLMTEVEIKCQAGDLPEFIEVDMAQVDMGTTLHLSDIKLPKGAALTIDIEDSTHDLPIASLHAPKGGEEEPEAPAADADQGEE